LTHCPTVGENQWASLEVVALIEADRLCQPKARWREKNTSPMASLKLTARTRKWMVGRKHFPIEHAIFFMVVLRCFREGSTCDLVVQNHWEKTQEF